MMKFRTIKRNIEGAVAVEFAVLVPVMILLFLGVVELSDAMTAHRKMTAATSTIADLVGQAKEIDDAEMEDVFTAVQSIMSPYDSSAMSMRLSSININLDGTVEVGWSDAINTDPYEEGDDFELPSELGQRGGSVVVAQGSYTHETITVAGDMIFGGSTTFEDEFYLEPRRTLRVVRKRP